MECAQWIEEQARGFRARLNNRIHCRSRREEAQISDDLAKNQSLLTSAPTILRHALSHSSLRIRLLARRTHTRSRLRWNAGACASSASTSRTSLRARSAWFLARYSSASWTLARG